MVQIAFQIWSKFFKSVPGPIIFPILPGPGTGFWPGPGMTKFDRGQDPGRVKKGMIKYMETWASRITALLIYEKWRTNLDPNNLLWWYLQRANLVALKETGD